MNKKGMALPVVLIFIFASLSLIMFIAATHKHDKVRQIVAREHYRSEYLAKGAVQLALLKARMLPQEFRDANTLYDGYGTIECISRELGNLAAQMDQSYLGHRHEGDQDHSRGPHKDDWIHDGEFIRELQMGMSPDSSAAWSHDGGLVVNGPFLGKFYVTEMKLLTRRTGNRSDAIRIKVWAQEESEKPMGAVTGGNSQTPLSEGVKYEEVHEIILK